MKKTINKQKNTYYYQGKELSEFCNKSKISYQNVTISIRYYKKTYPERFKEIDKLVAYVVDIHLKIKRKKEIKENFQMIFEDKKRNISKICKNLNINRYGVYKVIKQNFSIEQAILIIYFLYDNNNELDKNISPKKIREIKLELETKNYTNKLNYLVCYYYLGYDVFENILKIVSKTYSYNIRKIAGKFLIKKIKNEEKDLIQELSLQLFDLLENKRIVINKNYQIKTYISKFSLKIIYQKMSQLKNNITLHLEDILWDNFTLADIIGCYDTYFKINL